MTRLLAMPLGKAPLVQRGQEVPIYPCDRWYANGVGIAPLQVSWAGFGGIGKILSGWWKNSWSQGKQVREMNPEGASYLCHILEGDIFFAPLKLAQIGSVNAGERCEPFLAESNLFSEFADAMPELPLCVVHCLQKASSRLRDLGTRTIDTKR